MTTDEEAAAGKRLPRLPLDGRPGPAPRISEAEAHRLVDGAIHRAWQPAQIVSRVRSRRLAVVLSLAAALVVGSAAAGWMVRSRAFTSHLDPPTRPLPTGTPALPVTDGPIAPASSPSPTSSHSPSSEHPATSLALPAPPPPPEDLLRVANQLRAHQRWNEAERAYERVRTTFPGTSQAYTATVAAASLHLDHLGDPRGALRLFRTALREHPRGALSEEASWGVAQAERAIGDRSAEAVALRAFLAAHGDSLMANEARGRLSTLEGSAP